MSELVFLSLIYKGSYVTLNEKFTCAGWVSLGSAVQVCGGGAQGTGARNWPNWPQLQVISSSASLTYEVAKASCLLYATHFARPLYHLYEIICSVIRKIGHFQVNIF